MYFKKMSMAAVLFGGLFLSLSTDSSAKTVSSISELNDYLEGKENESVKVTLSSDFKSEFDYLMIHNNVKVEIDGDHHKFDEEFRVNSWGSGDLVFKNFNFVDNGEYGGDVFFGIQVQDSGEGTVTVDSFTFKNIENEMHAPLWDEADNNNLIVTNSIFENNSSYYGGGIQAQSTDGTTLIKNSSFLNNTSLGEGGGAYSGLESTKGITVENSSFINNSYTGTMIDDMGETYKARYSGAIEMNLLAPDEAITIKDSYFANNTSQSEDLYDLPTSGGISIHRIHEKSEVNITGTTFANNSGEGGGGAILVNPESSRLGKVKLENNTFTGNHSLSKDDDHYSGGAVLLRREDNFLNGPDTHEVLLSKNNTFYNNYMERSTQVIPFQVVKAGALSVDQINGTHNTTNDLMVGNYLQNNQTIDKLYENVMITNGFKEAQDSIGYDNGEAETITKEMVYGKYPIELGENKGKIKAGALSMQEIIPTLPIVPKMNEQLGLANLNVSEAPELDQRGYKRSGKNDNGAIEISSVVYDANKGNFTLNELTKYAGKTYYEGKNPKQYAKVDIPSSEYTIIDGKKVLKPVRAGYTFLGWSSKKNPSVVEQKVSAGSKHKVDDQLVLYAVWKEIKYSLKYYNNGKTTGVIPTQKEVKPETTVTVKNPTKMKRKGYKFIGWSPKANATKADANYKVGKKFKLMKNIKLYAIWKR